MNEIDLIDSDYYDVLLSVDANLRTKYSLLLHRLYHPSGMVKERTCSSIAKLLLHPDYADSFSTLLSQWIISQKLEIQGVYGVLAYLKAKLIDESYDLANLVNVVNQMKSPSLLTVELCKDILPNCDLSSIHSSLHSNTYPESYELNNFFQNYEPYFVSPSLRYSFLYNRNVEPIKLIKQWSYESDIIQSYLNFDPDSDILSYKGRLVMDHHTSFSTILSDIYSSAFLRAIAWGRSIGLLPEDERKMLTLTCPIDLGLWKIDPNSKPTYWLTVETTDEFNVEMIWDQVSKLWQGRSERTWQLGYIEGRIGKAKSYYDLSIQAFLFNNNISKKIDPGHLFSIIDSHNVPNNSSRLRCEGDILQKDIPDMALTPVPDFIPLSGMFLTENGLNWQFWRHHRLLHFPSLFLLNPPTKFTCFSDGIHFTENGELIAKWSDWTDGITEMRDSNLSLQTGNRLEISEDKLNFIQNQHSLNYGWACKVTEYVKTNRLEYDINRFYQVYS